MIQSLSKLLGFFVLILYFSSLSAQTGKKSDAQIQKIVSDYKADQRGPYRDIRWFCKDGTTLPPQERCAEPGGVQRARYKDEQIALARTNHVFLGQILATTDYSDFWDERAHNSRLKQYQLEQYLRSIDNGWVNSKAQFYRGAFQSEDEEAWGIKFFEWALADNSRVNKHFFLLRQAAKDIPHATESNIAQLMRSLSKEISDSYPSFMNLRVKIHGQPDATDIEKVKNFKSKNAEKLSAVQIEKTDKLIAAMQEYYKPLPISQFAAYAKNLPAESSGAKAIGNFINAFSQTQNEREKCKLIASSAWEVRLAILDNTKPKGRLALIDFSNKLETLLNRESGNWKPKTLDELIEKVDCLTLASAGFGYLEIWEWEQLNAQKSKIESDEIDLASLNSQVENGRRAVEWSIGMVRAIYQPMVKTYVGFEPLAEGFIDDRVRSSVLLQLGNAASQLGDFFSAQAGFSNSLMGIANQSSARGLNPGYAYGKLVVTTQNPEEIEVESDKIYIFDRPPADLKPVAGIATVSEGNLVSHVQLLARNLGIPNAVLSKQNLDDLLPFNGQNVFYAVSNKGRVILKPESEMSADEKALFMKKVRSEEKISVPVNAMTLDDSRILDLRNVDASLSGKVCGPKAANLGQLKKLYPDHVVEGLVIPFSIFKTHFDQIIPGSSESYWQYVNHTFAEAKTMTGNGISESEVETYVLSRLDTLRNEIKKMSFTAEFQKELKEKFKAILGTEIGKIPVFIRSDTNMEDLKDFTGAGLNLTLFNVLEADKIFEGIKDVWASPYTERSYKWRQKYLLNPENVFPSILIIPGVNVDCSGVLITKGVTSGNADENTVSFSRGVGGAVEGQASETWSLLPENKTILATPAREPEYMTVPSTGGVVKAGASFNERILTEERLEILRTTSQSLNEKLGKENIHGPYDVELGFTANKLWLFQVRPFVENKKAAASDYLRSISQELPEEKFIPLDIKL